MSHDNQRLAGVLTLAGIAPIWGLLVLRLWLDGAPLGLIALGYGAVIASFVCGVHWGLFMSRAEQMPFNLLVTSNVGALLAWAMLVLGLASPTAGFFGLALVLAGLLAMDWLIRQRSGIEPWFWRLRWMASLGLGVGLIVWGIWA